MGLALMLFIAAFNNSNLMVIGILMGLMLLILPFIIHGVVIQVIFHYKSPNIIGGNRKRG